MNLKPTNADKCVYFNRSQSNMTIVAIYVDDLIIATNEPEAFNKIKSALESNFKIKDLGPLHYCLGIEFHQDEESRSVKMSQRKYVEDVLKRFHMEEANPVSTPLESKNKLSKEALSTTNEEIAEIKKLPYRSLVGALMYLAVGTRPDIAHTVNVLSRFNETYRQHHWNAAKRVLRYLKRTADHCLTFTDAPDTLTGYVDSDWANDADDRVSYTGYVFKLANAAVTWESRKQRSVALSSTEAECMELSEAAKEATYLRNFLAEIGHGDTDKKATIIYCDNQGAQKLMRNPVFHSRTKHVDIRHHYVREAHEDGRIDVLYLPTGEMPADVLTKALNGPSHKKLTSHLGLT